MMLGTSESRISGEIAPVVRAEKVRRLSKGTDPTVLADIYEEEVNIATWQRTLPKSVTSAVSGLLEERPKFQTSMTVSPQSALPSLQEAFGASQYAKLAENAAELVDMFCCLFDLSRAGLRLTALDRAMCPRFHVDKVPCRLVTTYQGIATEWLPHHVVDRAKLGAGSNGLPDGESGLYQQQDDVKQLQCGDVALLKGENWLGNDNAGLVHRSPSLNNENRRLLLTLDFAQ